VIRTPGAARRRWPHAAFSSRHRRETDRLHGESRLDLRESIAPEKGALSTEAALVAPPLFFAGGTAPMG